MGDITVGLHVGSAIVGAIIGKVSETGSSWAGFFMGLVLGPVGAVLYLAWAHLTVPDDR